MSPEGFYLGKKTNLRPRNYAIRKAGGRFKHKEHDEKDFLYRLLTIP
jgi:hypothetical protein